MSSLNLNKVILCGRLTADPELKQTTTGIAVVSFSLAVNRRYQSKSTEGTQAQQTDFINVVAWRQTAEFISRYFRRGSALCITGSIQTRTWQDQQGQKRYATEVVADEASFVERKSESARTDDYQVPSFNSPVSEAPKFEEIAGDDDLPF